MTWVHTPGCTPSAQLTPHEVIPTWDRFRYRYRCSGAGTGTGVQVQRQVEVGASTGAGAGEVCRCNVEMQVQMQDVADAVAGVVQLRVQCSKWMCEVHVKVQMHGAGASAIGRAG
jgi:hypothetical protein